jgi:membrane protein YqaA with SNARE-associated domain
MFRFPLIIFIIIVSISKVLRYIFVGYIALKLL